MNILKKLTINKPNYLDIAFFAVLLVFCYFCFNQADILHTGGSSFTYLNGHIKDFYEVNKKLMGENNYLPSSYILYAIWNIPIKLLGIVNQATLAVGYVIFWYKLLPSLFLAASAYLLYKIGNVIGLSNKNARLMTFIWISAPILFFSQFIFGQYDIFTTFFVLLGLYYYLQRKTLLFILFFSISLTFKYFPVFIFVPLLLYVEKNPVKVIGYLALAMIPVALEILFYIDSPAFRAGVFEFGNAAPRLFLERIEIYPGIGSYTFLLFWLIICGVCYKIKPDKTINIFYQSTLYICLVVSCVLFTLVLWHPQWLLFMTPFLAISAFMSKDIKYYLLLDFLLMFAFVGYTVCFWQMNVDQAMLANGLLGQFNPNLINADKAFRMAKIFMFGIIDTGDIFRSLYFTVFAAVLVLNIWFQFPKGENYWNGNSSLIPVREYWNYARLRFFGGMMLFILPALIAYFINLYIK